MDVGRRLEHRVQRLETVLSHLEKNGGFGTVDTPDAYVRESSLNRKWGEIVSALFFAGRTDQTIVALGGSSKHLIGKSGSVKTTASYTHVLLDCLREIVTADEKRVALLEDETLEDDSLEVIESVVRNMKGPREPMEFAAKRLLYGRTQRRSANEDAPRVLLATSLYVARL